jgi:hypothetical protein
MYLGSTYVAIASSTGAIPENSPSKWGLSAQGINNTGAWNSVETYSPGDLVTLNGSSYLCVISNTNTIPPNPTYWLLFASKGDQGIQGYQGVQGPSGGPTGPQGIQGNQGNAGVTGATSNAGMRQQQVTAALLTGPQSFTITTANTPIATDRVYMIVDGRYERANGNITVAISVGSFQVNWNGAYDLTPNDDIVVTWFTTPP